METMAARVGAMRHFNRFYTRQIGVLQGHLLQSPFSLGQARVLYEVAHQDQTTARALAMKLGLDAGYLSRILDGFANRGLIERTPAATDRRQRLVRLTPRGRKAFREIDGTARREVRGLLRPLPEEAQARLIDAMRTIETILGGPQPTRPSYVLRAPRPGDMGWVVQRHGAVGALAVDEGAVGAPEILDDEEVGAARGARKRPPRCDRGPQARSHGRRGVECPGWRNSPD